MAREADGVPVILGPILLVFLGVLSLVLIIYQRLRLQRNSRYGWKSASSEDIQKRTLTPNGVPLKVSWWEDVGWRNYMEDRHRIAALGGGSTSFFGVYDGHGGDRASEFARRELHKLFQQSDAYADRPLEALGRAFEECDAQFCETAQMELLGDGSTLLAAALRGRRLLVANAGDCRAVLVQKGGRAHALTEDHKPNLPREKKRIHALGGKVLDFGSCARVEGVLAVSRAMGDFSLKPYVTASPDLIEYELTDDDLYLVLGSDGVWDVVTNETAARIVLSAPDFRSVARDVAHEAQMGRSEDNSTVIVVDLRGATDAPAQR